MRKDLGRIDAVIPDDLEKRLRIKAVQEFGGKKGSLTEAVERAIVLWVSEEPKEHASRPGAKDSPTDGGVKIKD